jgi:hypothetical protein
MLRPKRKGHSTLPADTFLTLGVDLNLQLGWSVGPSEQYAGGSDAIPTTELYAVHIQKSLDLIPSVSDIDE